MVLSMVFAKKVNGFSLIELMIAVSIIVILTAVGAANFQVVNKNARDGKRKSDLKLIQGALQQYYADNNYYPDNLNLLLSPRAYLKSLPQDPKGGIYPQYRHFALNCDMSTTPAQCPDYCLAAKLEVTPALSPTPAPDECSPTDTTNYNYGVTQP